MDGPPAELISFTSLLARLAGQRPLLFTQSAIARLERHPFPGNIRELRNVIERAMLLCDGPALDAAHVEQALACPLAMTTNAPVAPPGTVPSGTLQALEHGALREAWERHRGTRAELARQLGISERTLYRRLKALALRSQSRAGHDKPCPAEGARRTA